MKEKCLIALLCALLLLPVLLAPIHADIQNLRADAMTAGLFDAPVSFLTERLALRTLLLTARGKLLACIGESGSEQVILGREGFLFYADTLPDYLGTRDSSFIEALSDKLAALSSALAAEGRTLVLLVAPNKHTIYPELMPARYLKGQGQTCLEQLHAALTARGVRFVDAAAALNAKKAEGQLYFSGDTHWNARGAYIAFEALGQALGLAVDACPPLEKGRAGDLLILCQPGASPIEPDAQPVLARGYRLVRPMRTPDDMRIETAAQSGPSVLLLRDSFGAGLFPYLANAAGRLTLSRVYAGVLSQARASDAAFVVLEIAERSLSDLLEIELI